MAKPELTRWTMKQAKKQRLEAVGWKVGDVSEFLSLSAADSALIDVRMQLAKELRKHRVAARRF